jgi:hypothetical protein
MKRYPELSVDTASPQETKVNIDKNSEGVVASDKTFCVISYPKSDLRELCELASVLYPAVFGQLDIKSLTRIGLLLQFSKAFDTREAAADFVLAQTPIPKPSGKHLNVSGRVLDPEMQFRYEDGALGFRYRIWAQEVVVNVKLPPQFRDIAPEQAKRNLANFEVDYYTLGTTATSAFDAPTLIEGWLHLIRRDVERL